MATKTQYTKQMKWLDEIAHLFPEIARWVAWWDARTYPIFLAFLRFGYTNVTLAESRNSTL